MGKSDQAPALHLDRLERAYAQGSRLIEVLKGATASLYPGEAVALLGPSGAAVRPFEQSCDVEQRRLPRPRGPEQSNSLTGVKRRGRALEHLDDARALGISALQVLKVKRRRLI